jgi:precorrin-6B methylase 1
MPFMTNGKRDYKKELRWEKRADPTRVKDRAERNKARKIVGLKVGDPRDAGHKKALSKGGSTTLRNLEAQSAAMNRSFRRNKDGSMRSEKSKRER